MECTAESVAEAMRAVAAVVVEHREELNRLDREIGDGDHGENLARGLRALESKLDEVPSSPGGVLRLAATTLISTVGGAAGPLYGTAFLRAATSVGDVASVDGEAVAAALRAALDGVVARGKAALGDKTMVDALTPAVAAAESVAVTGGGVAEVLAAAAEAAEMGADSTVRMVARKGRASYLGERSEGHLDPGARSTALVLRTLAGRAR
ncbi:dihydroxyacetone kinase subunit DhaL [Saccharothrix texasensis]|uniref:Dihydroxyacetone kinase DhaL subunit n=1 Tax=Saccharothrix texasensis TaxID=103734 RepID=A0A3N1HDF5_9PSEU|nr:dihydroxyacetone kinase subunit DhaL [Saccharothrix texasensis]ROP40486.1 dihydroxyacetone kinase DhaL subunit [Saccharothrix texasensis]